MRESTFYGLDTEDDGAGTVHLAVIVSEHGERGVYRSAEEARLALGNLARANGKPAEVWTTNLAYEVVNCYWPELDATFPTFNRMGKVIHASVRGKKVALRDTLSFVQASVAKLGEMLKLPKLGQDFHSVEYCARDAEISMRAGMAVREGLEALGIERMGYTAGGTAYRAWRERVSGIKREPEEWCAGAYYGGRVETFRVGNISGPIHRWDVRSMYPSAMVAGALPLPGYSVAGWREGRLAWIDATVTVPDGLIGPLPVRLPERVLFPVGRFRGQWVSDEIESALALGARVEKVHDARTWTKECRPFDGWVSELWEYRQRGGVAKMAAKLLLNSLYGKFGQGKERLTVRRGNSLPYRWGERYTWGLVEAEGYPECTRYAWASFITARARVKLLKLLTRAGSSVVYCDTDSVFATSPALSEFEGGDLGQLESLGVADAVEILAPKVYRVRENGKWDHRAKGFPMEAAEELFRERKITHKRPLSLRRALRLDTRPGVWENELRRLTGGAGGRRELKNGHTAPRKLGD